MIPLPNAITPTLGGKQFWGDELFLHRWRIQRNVLTGHCRLLDGANRRHAWGSFEQCRAKLAGIRRERQLPAMQGTAVILLHGLLRSSWSMRKMSRFLAGQGGYSVFNVTYPTTRGSVHEHAERLGKIIAGLDGVDEIHFVAHSLGNLVIRRYLASQREEAPDKRIGRIVMLGPPNNGAALAEMLLRNKLTSFLVGKAGKQIADWAELAVDLAEPAGEFGIIAGGRGDERGYNPLLGEDNDLVVSVETTRLPGAADFAVLPVLHAFMMDDAKVQQYTLEFLRHGHFVSRDRRQSIERSMPVGYS